MINEGMNQLASGDKNATYEFNPFTNGIMLPLKKKKIGTKFIDQTDDSGVIRTTEVAEFTEVDEEEFIKIYTKQMKGLFELTPSTYRLMQVIFAQVQKMPGRDTIYLNLRIAQEYFTMTGQKSVSKPTFHRSIKELCEKKIIASSLDRNLYFINPTIIFNGDRVRFVKEVRKKRSKHAVLEEAGQQRLEL